MRTQTIKRDWHERGHLTIQRRDRRDFEPNTPASFVIFEAGEKIGEARAYVGSYGRWEFEAIVGDTKATGKSVRDAVLLATAIADGTNAKGSSDHA